MKKLIVLLAIVLSATIMAVKPADAASYTRAWRIYNPINPVQFCDVNMSAYDVSISPTTHYPRVTVNSLSCTPNTLASYQAGLVWGDGGGGWGVVNGSAWQNDIWGPYNMWILNGCIRLTMYTYSHDWQCIR